METNVKLPIGIENFEKIRTEGFYYVDKTGLITKLLNNWGEVNLFTRPRRFGKSLNMSMLKYFFEYGCDSSLFEGLQIAAEKELCDKYMGQFPVIFITLKDVSARDYKTAKNMLASELKREVQRFQFLLDSSKLTDIDKQVYYELAKVSGTGEAMWENVLMDCLLSLSKLLQKHYNHKVILLIDEYDVPLDKAQQYGYYDEMLILIRNLFAKVLKTNESLHFAVLTGCLRVSRESVFTGLNNFKIQTITDVRFDEHFGFTDEEVKELLNYYGFFDKYETARKWYDGYHFGNTEVYCPWDVINYVDLLRSEPEATPQLFWLNTSGNDIVRKFIQKATVKTKRELERLIDGGSVDKKINQELTYRDLYGSVDNLWSILFTTGYLTKIGKEAGDVYRLVIPNLEVKQIFIDQILEWFREEAYKDTPKLDAFCDAFLRKDVKAVEEQFNAYLKKTISIRDTSVRKSKKENFYHGILLGLLSHREDWDVESNAESGEGFSDILIETDDDIGIVIEVKYMDYDNLEAGCEHALEQIEKMGYETKLWQDGMTSVIKYAIACNKKHCKVRITGSG